MKLSDLTNWHNLIFLLPFAVAAILLAFSALHTGAGSDGDGDADGGHADGGHDTHGDIHGDAQGDFHGDADSHMDALHYADGDVHDAGHVGSDGDGHADADAHADADTHADSHTGSDAHRAGAGHLPTDAGTPRAGRRRVTVLSPAMGFLRLLGVGRAPMTVVFEAFCIGWGFFGFWANQLLVKSPDPALMQLMPSFGIGLAGGVFCARGLSEVFARLMPSDETYVVSRNNLFGMTGRVVFPVTETGGRLRIYDEHGSLHDNPCRVAPGHETIEKGRRALVVDMDAQGRLLVEEVPDTVQ
jgi:hypothetical protein